MVKIKVFIKYYLILISVFQYADSKGNNFINSLNKFISNANSLESFSKMHVGIEDTHQSGASYIDKNRIEFSIALNDTIEFGKIVNLINKPEYDKDVWRKSAIYLVYNAIIRENRCKNKDIKVKLVENVLDNSESVYGNVYSSLKYLNRSFFSDKSISRISDIINNGLNDNEVYLKCLMYDQYLYKLADTSFNKVLLKQLKNCSNDSCVLCMKQCLDSLNNGFLLNYKKYLKQEFIINTELIFLIGNSLLIELAPDLFNYMGRNPSKVAHQINIKLVLCRLNYQDFTDHYLMEISDLLKNDSVNILRKGIERELFYICNEKSLFYLSRFINFDYMIPCDGSDINPKYEKYGYYLISRLSSIIINSPQQFKPKDDNLIWAFCDIVNIYPKNAFQDFKMWMEANKEKYIINREIFKY